MCVIRTKQFFSLVGGLGSLVLLASPSWAGSVPSSDDILQSLGADDQPVVSHAPASKPAQSKPKASEGGGSGKGVMVFREVPKSDEILQGLGVPNKTRAIKMDGFGSAEPAKIETANAVYSASGGGGGAAEPAASGASSKAKPSKGMSVAYAAVFPTGSDVLTPDIKKYADAVAGAMEKKKGLKLHVSGHTDVSGGDRINDPLSQRRAEAFRRYLIESRNIEPDRLTASGEGSKQLANPDDPHAPENRRVQIDKQ